MNINAIRVLVLLLFVMLYFVVYTITTGTREDLIDHLEHHELQNLENSYRTSIDKFNVISDTFFTSVIRQDYILSLLYQAKHTEDKEKLTQIRKALYEKLKPQYDTLEKAGANIMLFSFENNKVFLRVHKPEKFGDDVSSVRYSIAYVNMNKEVVRGFEQGKISHAFRNIFPIYYKGEYLGCVDLSFSSEVVQDNTILLHETHTHFLLNKDLFDTNIWERQKKVKYIQSIEHDNFLFALTKSHSMEDFSENELKVNKNLKKDIEKYIKTNESFSIYDGDLILSFMAIKNIKENKTVAYLASYVQSYILKNIIHKHLVVNMIIIVFLTAIYFFIIENIKQRLYLQKRVNDEVEKNHKQQQVMFEQSRLAQMGEMISMIAHQWRQPLGAISVTSIDMKMQLEFGNYDLKDEKSIIEFENYIKESLSSIDGYVENLSSTIDDFRNFYKVNKTKNLIRLDEICRRGISLISSSLNNDGIEIIYEYKSAKEVEVFENELVHVILNILKNAQDNFREKNIKNPMIHISTTDNSISICDNGGGISSKIIKKIFDPYFSTKTEKNGTGLGLYMSKIIVEDHHDGKLSVLNVDNNTCFTIQL